MYADPLHVVIYIVFVRPLARFSTQSVQFAVPSLLVVTGIWKGAELRTGFGAEACEVLTSCGAFAKTWIEALHCSKFKIENNSIESSPEVR